MLFNAQVAKETTELIEGTIKKTEIGTRNAKETSEALGTIMNMIKEVANTIDNITIASSDQAASISQISQAIGQLSMTTQTNSATAEESAAASEELSAQARILKDAISRFKLRNNNYKKIKFDSEIISNSFMKLENKMKDSLSSNFEKIFSYETEKYGKY